MFFTITFSAHPAKAILWQVACSILSGILMERCSKLQPISVLISLHPLSEILYVLHFSAIHGACGGIWSYPLPLHK